jgi:small-conductance mechanosensitive channel
MRHVLIIALFAQILALVAPTPTLAQAPELAAAKADLHDWSRRLDRAQRETSALRLDEPAIERLTAEAEAIRAAANTLQEFARAAAGEVKELLDAMGEVPEGQEELAEAAAQRKELSTRLAESEGFARQAELARARADQLRDKIAGKRVEMFARELVRRLPSPAFPETWSSAIDELSALAALTAASVTTWITRLADPATGVRGAALGTLGGLALGAIAGLALAHLLRTRLAARPREDDGDRLILATGHFLARLAPFAFVALGAYVFWPSREMLPNGVVMALLRGVLIGGAILIVSLAAIDMALAPRRGDMRPLPVDDAHASALARRLWPMVVLLAIDITLDRAMVALSVVDNLTSLWALLAATAMALLAARLLDRSLWSWALPAGHDGGWSLVRMLALGALWAAPVAALAGYANIAQYLYVGVVETGLVLVASTGIKRIAHAALGRAFDPSRVTGIKLRRAVDRRRWSAAR